MRKTLAFLHLTLILIFSIACIAYAKDSNKNSPIKVGYYNAEIFQEGASENAVKKGYAYEYYQKLSEYTGWRYEYVYGDFDDLYEKLKSGDIDMLAGITYKSEREGDFRYPKLPMGNENYNLMKKDSAISISADPQSLNGKSIGVLESAMVEKLSDWLTANEVDARLVTYQTFDSLYEGFDNEEFDALMIESSGTYARPDAEVFATVGSADYYIGVNKNRPDILSKLNLAQMQLETDEPYYQSNLYAKYYPRNISNRAFAYHEMQWVNTHADLIVGYLNHYLPYSDTDSSGEVTGLIKDYVPEMLINLGLENRINIKYVDFDEYDEMIEALTSETIDIAFPVGGGVYYSEMSGIYNSDPVISATQDLVFKGEYPSGDDVTIAINENNKMQYYYTMTNFPEYKIVFYPTIDDCLDAVMKGEVDCTTLNGLRANSILKNSRYESLDRRVLTANSDRCIGVKLGNDGLLKIINRGVSSIGEQQAVHMCNPYTNMLYKYTAYDFVTDNSYLLFIFIIFVAVVSICIIVRENQRDKVYMEELERLNDAKTRFLFNMSHDIRTPMNAIIGFTDLLEKNTDDSEKVANYVSKIKVSSRFLLSLINNVLEMSRIESGNTEVDEIPWSTEIFNNTLFSVFDEQMKNNGITFNRTISVKHDFVFCDPVKIREVFLNILSNALKYTPAGGTVNLTLNELKSDREGYVLFETTVSDNGIGMSEEFLPHLFEEFSREHTTTETRIEGTGLGMPIVKKLIDLMGGEITVDSKLGVGTTFVVRLYHRVADESMVKEMCREDYNPSIFYGKKVLLAEDNGLNAEIAMYILAEAGFVVDIAEDGLICYQKLINSKPGYYDLILMDIQMPNMDGYEATKMIRKLEDKTLAGIPIIAMTANAFEEDRKNALNAGMNAHLAKPIRQEELFRELAVYLSR